MAPHRRERPGERGLRLPGHCLEHRQGPGRQRHRRAPGHHILTLLQQVMRSHRFATYLKVDMKLKPNSRRIKNAIYKLYEINTRKFILV